MKAKNLRTLLLILCVCCTGTLVHSQHRDPATKAKPNIVFILADDLGWVDLPVYGNTFNEAPNIARMAARGMQFRNAYVAAPVCSPSRASIMSGQYPARLGLTDFITGHWWPYEKLTVPVNRTQYLPLSIVTLGELLKKAGYKTGYFGKWHLGRSETYQPANQGFDESVVYQGGGYYGSKLIPKQDTPEGTRLSETLTDLGTKFIEKNKENPFFLFLSHFDVHVQLDADSGLIDKYLKKEKPDNYPSNAIYAAMIEQLDQSVGKILEELENQGISDNTIVVFYSDNGGLITRGDKNPLTADSKRHLYENNALNYIATSNRPLRNEKGSLYEGGIRVPLIIQWPGQIQAGSETDIPVTGVDMFPTFADLAGIELPEDQVTDGESILPILKGRPTEKERPLFWHYPHYHHDAPSSAVRLGRFKLIEFYEDGHLELYDLENDVSESHNLVKKMPVKANRLWSLLSDWKTSVHAELPRPNINFNPDVRGIMGVHPDRK